MLIDVIDQLCGWREKGRGGSNKKESTPGHRHCFIFFGHSLFDIGYPEGLLYCYLPCYDCPISRFGQKKKPQTASSSSQFLGRNFRRGKNRLTCKGIYYSQKKKQIKDCQRIGPEITLQQGSTNFFFGPRAAWVPVWNLVNLGPRAAWMLTWPARAEFPTGRTYSSAARGPTGSLEFDELVGTRQ